VDRFYVAVVAEGVASLHVMEGTGGPGSDWRSDVRYTWEGLGSKLVVRNLVVEPWEQWHRRDGGQMTTEWALPGGESGRGDVELPSKPRTLREWVDRTVDAYRAPIERQLAYYERRKGGAPRFVLLVSRRWDGDRMHPLDQEVAHVFVREALPTIRRTLGRPVEGFDPVVVQLEHGTGIRWLSRGRRLDVAEPRPVNELRTDFGAD
jgi:hypothetical protein